MRIFLAALTLPAMLWAGAAIAQAPAPTPAAAVSAAATPASVKAQVEVARPRYTGPEFRLFGIPIRLGAPVPPPYAGTAYDTFAGQPETSHDQALAQDKGSEPQQ